MDIAAASWFIDWRENVLRRLYQRARARRPPELGEHRRLMLAGKACRAADIFNVTLLCRLRRCRDWLALPVGRTLAAAAPQASGGRMIRIIDATAAPKAGASARKKSELWRIHSAFDLPHERFGHSRTDRSASG